MTTTAEIESRALSARNESGTVATGGGVPHQDTTPSVVYATGNPVGKTLAHWMAELSDLVNGYKLFNVITYGAVGDGVTDNHTAFQAAIDAAIAVGGTVYVPTGIYNFTTLGAGGAHLDLGIGGIAFKGDGSRQSVLQYWEGTGAAAQYLLANFTNDAANGSLSFQDLGFTGPVPGSLRTERAGIAIVAWYYTEVVVENCAFTNIASQACRADYCGLVRYINNTLENIVADGLAAWSSADVTIIGNSLKRIGDDAISIHNAADSGLPVPSRKLIVGNNLVNTGSIKCLGAQNVIISNNNLKLIGLWGIQVSVYPGSPYFQGTSPQHSILIQNNTISDVVDRSGSGPPSNYIYIGALDPRGVTATHSTIPQRYDSTGTSVVRAFEWYDGYNEDATFAIPPLEGVHILDNVCMRTLPAVSAISDWGFGTSINAATGAISDPAMGDSILRLAAGIQLGTAIQSMTNVVVRGNTIEHMTTGMVMAKAPSRDLDTRNVLIENNIIFDASDYGIYFNSAAFNVATIVRNNTIDCDYYRVNSNSNLNGSYDAEGFPVGVRIGLCQGVIVEHNKFKNVCNPFNTLDKSVNIFRDNIGYCSTPAAVSFNTGNKGIGSIITDYEVIQYQIEDCDPTSGTYGDLTSQMVRTSSAMPATGWYYVGWFVRNTAPTAIGILGWTRITTGSNHVLGTDWVTTPVKRANFGAAASYTIATGAIAITAPGCVTIDTQNTDPTDDLDTITGGTDGDLIVIRSTTSARDPTLKDGTGNLLLNGDFVLDTQQDRIVLIWDALQASWMELCRSSNA